MSGAKLDTLTKHAIWLDSRASDQSFFDKDEDDELSGYNYDDIKVRIFDSVIKSACDWSNTRIEKFFEEFL